MPKFGLGVNLEKNNSGHEATVTPGYVTDGLVGNWDAGDAASYPGSGTTWTDLTGNNDGVLTNGPVYTASPNPNFAFDGDNDYVELGSINSANPLSLFGVTGFAIEFWIQADLSGDPLQRIIAKSNGGAASGGYSVFRNGSALDFYINTVSVISFATGFVGWKQFVLTRNSSNVVRFYRDGVLSTTTTLPAAATPFPSTTTNARIATWNHSTGREYKGELGIVRVYNVELTTAEVLQNYDANKAAYGLS